MPKQSTNRLAESARRTNAKLVSQAARKLESHPHFRGRCQTILIESVTIGVILLGLYGLLRWRVSRKTKLFTLIGVVGILLISVCSAAYFYIAQRYQTAEVMEIPITEYAQAQYPEAPTLHPARR